MENFPEASYRKLGAIFSSPGSSFSDEDELRRVMDELDSDHDGFISLTEFAAFCRSSSEDGGASELHDVRHVQALRSSILMGIEAACENWESLEKWQTEAEFRAPAFTPRWYSSPPPHPPSSPLSFITRVPPLLSKFWIIWVFTEWIWLSALKFYFDVCGYSNLDSVIREEII